MNEKQVQQRFFKFYSSLELEERKAFRDRILEECKVSYPAFYSWLKRANIGRWHIKTINQLIDEFEDSISEQDQDIVAETLKSATLI
jgi:hypothetical protein